MSFRRTWRRFASDGRTLGPSPGVREAWHRGRTAYHVHIIQVEDLLVQARLAQVREALSDWVRPWSVEWPHVTVWVSGFLAPAAPHPAEGCRVPLVVGGASSFASCPFLEVRAPAIGALREGFVGREERWAPYLPHLTVGLYRASGRDEALVRRLRELRRLPALRTEGRFVAAVVDPQAEDGRLRVLEPGEALGRGA